MAEAVASGERRAADALIAGPSVSAATRAALLERMEPKADRGPRFFMAHELETLVAECGRLLPPSSPVDAREVALGIDTRLAGGGGDGWRYDTLPPDGDAYRLGLAALRAEATGAPALSPPKGAASAFDLRRWREDLLVEVSAAHVAHPLSQLRMGCTAFADIPPADQREDGRSAYERPALAAPMKRHAHGDIVDAVVIGTGAGGGPLLWRLARAGLSVVALEAGVHWNPARDFATDEKAQEKLFWTDERLSAGADPLAFGSNNSGIGVGGSTLHFTAYTPRPQPDDLRLASETGVGVDWPFGHDQLAPYLDEIEAIVGISGPASYPWGPPRKNGYPLPPLPLNAAALAMQRGCEATGIATSPAANAALSQSWSSLGQAPRHACTQRGFCQAGCTTGAKGSVDVVFIPPALAHGAELRTESFATRIERDAHGRVSGVVYMQGGVETRQRCRNVFLCAGAVETPRLLLMNEGLGNSSGQVGRNLMAHCGLQLWGFFDQPMAPWRGIPGGLISEDMHRPRGGAHGDIDFAGGYLLQSIGVMPVTYASQLARSGKGLAGAALGEHLSRFDHVAGINILGDCLPADHNHLTLSDELDARGLPKPRVHFGAGDNETRMTAHAEKAMRAIWSAAGARDVWRFQRFAHVIGTCRMGDDRKSAVVDADGRSFDVPGLHICDNSVFPSALSVNPALTIMALSLRTADRFLVRNGTRSP